MSAFAPLLRDKRTSAWINHARISRGLASESVLFSDRQEIVMSDPNALLIVLLATTGLTQTSAAALIGVAGRTMPRY